MRNPKFFPLVSVAVLLFGLSACGADSTQTSPSADTKSAVASSEASPAEAESKPAEQATLTAADLEAKILTGDVNGVTFQVLPELPDPSEIVSGSSTEITPAQCASPSLPAMDVGAMGGAEANRGVVVLLGTDSTYAAKYREFVEVCSNYSGTADGVEIAGTTALADAPAIDGVDGLVAISATADMTLANGPVATKSYLVAGIVDGVSVSAATTTTGGAEPDFELVHATFQAQVDQLRS